MKETDQHFWKDKSKGARRRVTYLWGASGDVDLDDAEVEINEETRGSLCLPPDLLVENLHTHG